MYVAFILLIYMFNCNICQACFNFISNGVANCLFVWLFFIKKVEGLYGLKRVSYLFLQCTMYSQYKKYRDMYTTN